MDSLLTESSFHDSIRNKVAQICRELGYETREEFKGKDWRADVFVLANGIKYAFEIQTSIQTIRKTLERQDKYIRDGIIGCWLFEKEPKQKKELEHLPLFKLNNKDQITVSLKDRKELSLKVFIKDYLQRKIRFCNTLNPLELEVRFIKMDCWKCGHENHIYYIGDLITPCNAKIFFGDIEMWISEKLIFTPKIVSKVTDYAKTNSKLNMATIKERYSNTVEKSYLSFGCAKCDSIFGDWFVFEAIIDTWYGNGVIDKMMISKHEVSVDLHTETPHWCHPGENDFCE
jgi:hypothetical protein